MSKEQVPAISQYKPLYDLAFLLGATLIIFYASLTISAAFSFISGWKLTPLSIVVATIIASIFYIAAGSKGLSIPTKHLFIGLAILVLVWLVALLAAGWMYDLSWDGRDYHQRAVYELAHGWNPVKVELQPLYTYYNQWLNHYPKAPWIVAAAIYQLSGNIESGKAMNLVLIVACFMITFYLIGSYHLNPVLVTAGSLVCALNPVSVYQSFTFYVDGQVASMYAIVLVLMLIAIRHPSRLVFLTIGAALVTGLNIKFTASMYLLILTGGLFIFYAFRWYCQSSILPPLEILAAGTLVGIFVAGYQPYVTNTLNYGNPYYPVYGSQVFTQVFPFSEQAPSNFEGKNRFEKLFLATFSRSQNIYGQDSGPIKFPLSVSIRELLQYGVADIRVGGFGPWFGAAVLLAMVIWLLLFFSNKMLGMIVSLVGGLIAFTALINPETWWARYAPQWWLIVVLVMCAGLISQLKYARLFSYILLLMLALNIAMVAGSNLSQNALITWRTKQTFSELARQGETVLIYDHPFELAHLKFDQWHLHYRVVDSLSDLPCPHPFMKGIYYSPIDCSP
ncbi:MAG: hypothetical protein A2136_01530 [Chloroflexi bacterium RBG_16_54_11]|nr:MAG: hypothetical protein A2136_01530 [Chloroflexi bacterium RBG_16_54_11]